MQNCLIFYAKLSHFLRKIVSFFTQNCLIFYAKLSHFLRKIVSFFMQNCLIFTQNCLIFYAKLSHFLRKHLYYFWKFKLNLKLEWIANRIIAVWLTERKEQDKMNWRGTREDKMYLELDTREWRLQLMLLRWRMLIPLTLSLAVYIQLDILLIGRMDRKWELFQG